MSAVRLAGRWLGRALVLGVLAGMLVLAAAQHGAAPTFLPLPLVELSRYLPFYWLGAAVLLGGVVAWPLGRRWVALAVVPMLLLAATTDPSFGGLHPAAGGAGIPFRLMTYNVKAPGLMRSGIGLGSVEAEVRRVAPDILVLQDADGLIVGRADAPRFDAPPLFGLAQVVALGQYVVASRFPLRDCRAGQIDYRSESHRYLRCRAIVGGRSVELVTAHFKSPRGGLARARREGLAGLAAWSADLDDRLAQARALAADIARLPGPIVVAGDLNAADGSPVVQTLLATGLRDAHAAAGTGWGFTYGQSMRAGISFLRIDHVLTGRGVSAVATAVGAGEPSEHRALIADLRLEAAGEPAGSLP